MSAGRLLSTTLSLSLSLSLLVACSGTSASPLGNGPEAPLNGDGPGDVPPSVDEDDTTPHALGSIVLGETHVSGTSTPRAIVSIVFVPDAAAIKTCTRAVAGCALTVPCDKGNAPSQPIVEESFDAGPVAISGATTPLTLYPPYAFDGEVKGAPFLAGAELRFQAPGAASTGFEGFDEKITATQLIQASPRLADLPRTSVFGAGTVPVTWVPGPDRITITVSGQGGSIACQAEDKSGRFEVPREVVKTALGAASSVTFSLARERTETKKGKKTKGKLAVHPAGWLSLSTTSSESTTFQCSGAECTGPSTCHDCRTSKCKTEFDVCTADATCPMLRTCLDECTSVACRNQCFVKWPDPVAKQKNGALYKCQCLNACATDCTAECK